MLLHIFIFPINHILSHNILKAPKNTRKVFQKNRQINDLNLPHVKMYHFPSFKDLPLAFKSLDQINENLDIALKNYNQKTLPSNRIEKTMVLRETQTGAILKCRMRDCNAYILFQLNKQTKVYNIYKIETEHQHRVRSNKRGRHPKFNNKEVEQCSDELQLLNFKPRQVYDFIKNKFKISRPHFNSIKFCRSRRQSILSLQMAISKYDHFFVQCKDMRELVAHYKNQKFSQNVTKERDMIIIVSKKMKQLYESYHCQFVYFSMFQDIVLQTRHTKTLNYEHVGVLYGEDVTGGLNLLFGLVIIRKPIRLAYLYIFEKMFNFLGKYPKVIITDYDQALSQAIKRLRERCKIPEALKHHIQMPKNFITATFQQNTHTDFLSVLTRQLDGIIKDPDAKSHKEKVQKLFDANEFNSFSIQQTIASQLGKFISSNSLIELPPVFIGLAMTSSSAATLLKARILDFFKSPRPVVLTVKAFFEIFQIYPILRFLSPEQIQARINPPKVSPERNQKLHILQLMSKQFNPCTKIKQLIKALPEPAALHLYENLEESLVGNIELIKQEKKYFYRAQETENHFPYTIRRGYQNVNGIRIRVWRCSCKLYFKSGIPCWHQLKTCLNEGSDLILQVNPYWLVNAVQIEKTTHITNYEHDVKSWHEEEHNQKKIYENMNLSQLVGTSNQSNFFIYDFQEKEQPEDTKMNQGIGQIIQELDDIKNWQLSNLPMDEVKQEVKYEEDIGLTSIPESKLDLLEKDQSILDNLVKLEADANEIPTQFSNGFIGEQFYDEQQLQKLNNLSLHAESLYGTEFNFEQEERQDLKMNENTLQQNKIEEAEIFEEAQQN